MKKEPTTEVVTTSGAALSIPSAVLPKPTKNELIEALLERARVKHAASKEAYNAKFKELQTKAFKLADKEIRKAQETVYRYVSPSNRGGFVKMEYRITNPEIEEVLKEMDKLENPGHFDAAYTKRSIRESLSKHPTGRKNPLLENKDAVKALDQFVTDNAIA